MKNRKTNYLLETDDDKQFMNELHDVPKFLKKTIETPRFQVFESNFLQQADLLYLPEFNGFKYLLVVVDGHSKKCDAIPLKNSSSDAVLKGFKIIYGDTHNILELPKIIQVDQVAVNLKTLYLIISMNIKY